MAAILRRLRFALLVLPLLRPAQRTLHEAEDTMHRLKRATGIFIGVLITALLCLIVIAVYAVVQLVVFFQAV
ncbi:MAG: hypothetical protein PHW10_03400 [Candidatus Peribacteraceae bacterium]|nr:hypothetical protein [Candidatus Peribacteraceae bacterium]